MKLPVLTLIVAAGLTLAGCGPAKDPCRGLAPPTPAELAAVAVGAQVERDVNDSIECELRNGRWQRETD